MKVKDSYNVDTLAIAAATAAIKDQAYFRANAERVKKDRKVLAENLESLGFKVMDSSSNFLLARCVNGNAGRVYDSLAERNIYVRYFNIPGLNDKLRITVGTSEQNEKLISALKEILS